MWSASQPLKACIWRKPRMGGQRFWYVRKWLSVYGSQGLDILCINRTADSCSNETTKVVQGKIYTLRNINNVLPYSTAVDDCYSCSMHSYDRLYVTFHLGLLARTHTYFWIKKWILEASPIRALCKTMAMRLTTMSTNPIIYIAFTGWRLRFGNTLQ